MRRAFYFAAFLGVTGLGFVGLIVLQKLIGG
jgi:hypothetical protein